MKEKTEKKDDILKEIKDRFREAYDYTDEQYSECISDLEFLKGDQWPEDLKAERVADGRPCLVISKLPVFADMIIGDIRQNEPSITVKGVDSKSDPETAEIISGLMRNIEIVSDAEIAYDTAVESSIQCGIGAFRIVTEYSDDDSFEQDILIKRIKNPFTIYWDPATQEWDNSDARYCFITSKIPRTEFEKLYPDAAMMSFDGRKDRDYFWGDDKTIRVVEYFKKVDVKKHIYLMKDPAGNLFTTDVKPDLQIPELQGWSIEKDRVVESYKIVWYKATQSEIIEGPQDWPGKYIPICMVYGKELNIEGKTYYRGVVRNSKDPQRLYNYSRSTGAEVISLAPKAPYIVTAKMISNYQPVWDQAHKKNFPYLPYEPDPHNPQAVPHRSEPIVVNTGILSEIQISDQEIHDTTGLQLASLGKKSNEKSGRAIIERQKEGDTAQFPYYDNLGRAMRYAGKVILDLIPKIYDTARIVRIINPDNTEKQVVVNQAFGTEGMHKIYDITVGKYDVVVAIGPSYKTQREEAADNMFKMLSVIPQAGPLMADLLFKNLDWPGSAEISKRLKLLLPPQLQQEPGEKSLLPPSPPDPRAIVADRGMAADVQKKELENRQLFNQMKMEEMGGGEDKNAG